MTPGELAVWRAVYAVAWFQPTGRATPGHVTDGERAISAADQADRALAALRSLNHPGVDVADPVAKALR